MPRFHADKLLRPAALLFFLFCVAGFLCGLWPELIYVPPEGETVSGGTLPVLRCLAVAQIVFFTLVYPLVCLRRDGESAGMSAAEAAVMFALIIPLYYAASVFSDAAAADCLRAWIAVIAVFPLALACGRLLRVERSRTPGLAGMILFCPAPPLLYYLFIEFCPALNAEWIAEFSPVLYAWSNAGTRMSPGEWRLLPMPLWSPAAWVVIGAALLLWCRGNEERREE